MNANSQNYQHPYNSSTLPGTNDADKTALDIMQRTGNWGYIETYMPQMSNAGIDAVIHCYNGKHQNPNEHKKAPNYYSLLALHNKKSKPPLHGFAEIDRTEVDCSHLMKIPQWVRQTCFKRTTDMG